MKEFETISEVDFIKFYTDYKGRFIIQSYDTIRNTLKDSRILIFEDDEIYFGYDYILYYLSARKIAKIINTPEGKKVVNYLFQNLQVEKNGNILVFVTHHSQDFSFIEESLLNSMIILTDYAPITLATDDPFYNHIKTIAEDLSAAILEINRNPKEERQKKLKELDKREAAKDNLAKDENPNSPFLPIRQSLRSIEIVGQIIRNRKGSLEKSHLKNMITEVYTTGFRTISYTSNLLISVKDKLILTLNSDDTILESSRAQIKEAVTDFVIGMSFESCLGVFGKITGVMGIKDLKGVFNEVADEMNTPAAKLVSFGINSYYGNISESELKTIVAYLKGNTVALSMLRGRVKAYVYSKNLDIKTKQKFAKLLDMAVPTSKQKQDY